MKKLRRSIPIVIIIAFLVIPSILMAQPPDPCPDPAFPDCPIDSGLVFLIAVAVLIAIKKAYDFKKQYSDILT